MEINMDVEWMLRIGAAVSGGWNEKEEVVLRLYYDMECNNARTEMSGRFIFFLYFSSKTFLAAKTRNI